MTLGSSKHDQKWCIFLKYGTWCCGLPTTNTLVASDEIVSAEDEEQTVSVAWWDTINYGYIHDHLRTLLREAGCEDGLIWLLLKPQWITMLPQKGGINRVEDDLDVGKRAVSDEDSAHQIHLDILDKTTRMSCTFVDKNRDDAWF